VEFEILTADSMQMALFWVVAPCSLAEIYQHFRGTCCPHNEGDSGIRDSYNTGFKFIIIKYA
jgi:hypothetical protein